MDEKEIVKYIGEHTKMGIAIRIRALRSVLSLFVIAGVWVSAAISIAQSFDSNGLRPGAARSHSGLVVPSAELLDEEWEFSLSYAHEGLPIRTDAATGAVRGSQLSETVDYIESRDLLLAQAGVGFANRFELLMSLPILLGQGTNDGEQLSAPRAGSSAQGDLRMVARAALLDTAETDWRWAVGLGLTTPTGQTEFAFGEQRARFDASMQAGYRFSPGFSLDIHAGFQQNEMGVIGNQFFGDHIQAGLLARMGTERFQILIDGLFRSVIADKPADTNVERVSLEANGVFRVSLGDFFVDAGGGAGILDNHLSPRWRAMVSVGAHQFFGQERASMDDDRDGIINSEDGCVSVPEDFDLFEDEDGCPDRDNDGDGIMDAKDRCPDTPEDMDGIEDSDGCPESDADADAIPDDNDECPGAAEDYDGVEDDDGCPESATATPTVNARAESAPPSLEDKVVHFDTDSAVLTELAEARIRDVARLISRKEARVRIIGHADERGTDAHNEELSRSRANTVKDTLVDAGVDAGRLEVIAAGSSAPDAPSTDFGMSMNRRVTFEFIDGAETE